jgi:hypothetical protein
VRPISPPGLKSDYPARPPSCQSGEYRRPGEVAAEACQWHAVTGLTNADADLIGRRSAERGDSWNDLTTAGTPEFLNSKQGGRDFVEEPPIHPKLFFYIHCTCGRASTPYRINLFARGIYAPTAQDGWPVGMCAKLPLWQLRGISCHNGNLAHFFFLIVFLA